MAKNNTLTLEAQAPSTHLSSEPGFFTADITMLILTWVTFFLLLAILHKFAWKPILAALDQREKAISKSVEDADKIKAELEKLEETSRTILNRAEAKAKEVLDQSRRAAVEAAKIIEQKVREESKILMENARREINEEKEKAQAELREESANIAVELAGKIIDENLDSEKNRKLVNRFIKEI